MSPLQVRFSGFRAIKAGLLADTFIEATHVEKTKLGYDDVFFDEESKRKVHYSMYYVSHSERYLTHRCIFYI